ncbi:MAG: hypothetical protein IAE80_01215, partial [Anaerolinea sp.]|nr:hypothetical protein [Anaerolinea sp.]
GAARSLAAALGMGALVAVFVWALDGVGVGRLITALIAGAVGVGAFFALALVLRLDEARTIPRLLLRRGR